MPVDPPSPVLSGRSPALPRPAVPGSDRVHRAAQQFDAMFMTEMLRQARPQFAGHGRFAVGQAEKSWQIFMDQALGEAAAAKGGSGLAGAIEQSLRAAGRMAPAAPPPGKSRP